MDNSLLGVPLPLYGIPCLMLAFVFAIVWPRQAVTTSGLRRLILRWGHALVWVLLGLAAFSTSLSGHTPIAAALALTSLAVYVVFLITLVTTKRQ